MNRYSFLFFCFLLFFSRSALSAIIPYDSGYAKIIENQQDTLKENQILYNGKLWKNLYYNIMEDQYLFSKDYLKGSLTINGESFRNISLKYDIYNDEITTPSNLGIVLQLTKERIDSFTLDFQNRTYRFAKIQEDTLKSYKGYFNVLYKGNCALYVKYKKEIELLAVDRKWDMFYQTHRIYFENHNIIYSVSGKGDLLRILSANKDQLKSYIKKNKLKVSKKRPESFVPILRFYDSLSK